MTEALGWLSEVATSTRPSAVGSMLNSFRCSKTRVRRARRSRRVYGSKGAEGSKKGLRRTTAGFAASRNKGRDINSNDSLINYLQHPNGVLFGHVTGRVSGRRLVPNRGRSCGGKGTAQQPAGEVVPVLAIKF